MDDAAAYRFAALGLALLLLAACSRLDRLGRPVQILLRLPATLLHETAHYLAALLTGGRPTGFSLIPRCEESRSLFGRVRRRWVLGSVTLRSPGAISAFPAALAPLLYLPVAALLYLRWFRIFPAEPLHALLLALALLLCAAAAVPSKQDLAVAFSRPVGLLLYGTLIGAALLCWDRLFPVVRSFVF